MNFIKTSLLTLFHPVVAFQHIKSDREHFDYSPPIIMTIVIVLIKMYQIYFTHFPLAAMQARYADIFYECIVFFAPIFSWVVASYAITTIIEGETMFREALSAAAYSLLPIVIITIPLTLFSRVLEYEQRYLYYFFEYVMWGWMLLLFFINIKVMNHYTIKKTIIIVLISIFTMIIIWATLALFMAISAQFVTFVNEMLVEIKLMTS